MIRLCGLGRVALTLVPYQGRHNKAYFGAQQYLVSISFPFISQYEASRDSLRFMENRDSITLHMGTSPLQSIYFPLAPQFTQGSITASGSTFGRVGGHCCGLSGLPHLGE